MIRERVGTEIGLVTGRIKQGFRNGRDSIAELGGSVSHGTRRAVRKTDYYVHDNAWKMLGIAAGLAFVAGYLLSRKQEAFATELAIEPQPDVNDKAEKITSWGFVHSALPLALFLWRAVQASRCARRDPA